MLRHRLLEFLTVLYLAVQLVVTNVLKLVPQEFNLNEAYLYAPLEEINVSDTNLSESNIVVRKHMMLPFLVMV